MDSFTQYREWPWKPEAKAEVDDAASGQLLSSTVHRGDSHFCPFPLSHSPEKSIHSLLRTGERGFTVNSLGQMEMGSRERHVRAESLMMVFVFIHVAPENTYANA